MGNGKSYQKGKSMGKNNNERADNILDLYVGSNPSRTRSIVKNAGVKGSDTLYAYIAKELLKGLKTGKYQSTNLDAAVIMILQMLISKQERKNGRKGKNILRKGTTLKSTSVVRKHKATPEEIKKWFDLLQSGAITQEEYDKKKKQLL